MYEYLNKITISSGIIESYYEKLRKLGLEDKEDTKEYYEIVNKLKKMIQGEESIYEEISEDELEEVLIQMEYCKKNEINIPAYQRMYLKLTECNRRRKNLSFTTELGNIISSKIIIDVLKLVNQKLLKLSTTDISEEEIIILVAYANISKYNYLTGNAFIEKLSLEYYFDIEALPTIKFDEIEKTFQTEFVSKSTPLFFEYIKDSIEELLSIKTDDEHLNVYITLFEVSRIEVMLPYLNKESLIKLSNYLNNLNIKEETSALKKIKKLINKRKEEFE